MNMNVLKNRLIRLAKLMFAFFIFGLTSTMMIKANIGSSSWVALNQGISLQTGIKVGQVNTIVGLFIIGLDFAMKEPIGFGTILNAIFVGTFNDFWMDLGVIPTPETYIGKLLMLVCSLFISAGASILYMGGAMGCGPRDTFMVMINKKLKNLTMGKVVIMVSVVILGIAWLLGAKIGLGTVICFTLQGTITDIVQGAFHFKPINVKHENMVETIKALRSKDAE